MTDINRTHPTTKVYRMLRHRMFTLLLAAAAAPLLSCTNNSTAPGTDDTRDPTDLRLLTAPYGTPTLARTQVSFYAVQGARAVHQAADAAVKRAQEHRDFANANVTRRCDRR